MSNVGNFEELTGLFSRAYNNKMIKDDIKNVNDEADIREYCKLIFNSKQSADPAMLWQFNNLIVQQADEIAKPMLKDLLSLFANFTTTPSINDRVKIVYPQSKMKTRVIWSANGTGVDLVRLAPHQTSEYAEPQQFSTGFYYEPSDMQSDAVENYRKVVNDLAEAKVRLYYNVLSDIMVSAMASGKIPAKNVKVGTDLTLADYNKVATTLSRYGGRPVFVGDMLLIDYFKKQEVTDAFFGKLISEDYKNKTFSELVPTSIGRTVAVDLYNPFIDRTNAQVDLKINEGFMFAGSATQKPFTIVEFGSLQQKTGQDPEDERIKIKLVQFADIKLVQGWTFGYIKEDGSGVSL
jgi:hypothetical protein